MQSSAEDVSQLDMVVHIPASGCRDRRTRSSRYPSVIQRIRGQPRLLMTLSLKSKQANKHTVLLFYEFSGFWFDFIMI